MASTYEQEPPQIGQHPTTADSKPNPKPKHASLPALLPAFTLAHPESIRQVVSRPGQISFLVEGQRVHVTLDQDVSNDGTGVQSGEPWIRLPATPELQEPLQFHIECTFLAAEVLRVRMGLAENHPFPDPFPIDDEFPLMQLRPHLFPPGTTTEPVAGDQRSNLTCGLDLRANDGRAWVNPPGSGLELRHSNGPFTLRATYGVHGELPPQSVSEAENELDSEQTRTFAKPFFEQASSGPWSPSLLPSGILALEDNVFIGTELLILDEGEKLASGGPGRHVQHALAQELPPSTEKDESTKATATLSEADRALISDHFAGPVMHDLAKLQPPSFLYTNREWGVLMKDPVAVNIGSLADGRAVLSLSMRGGKDARIDYLVVRGKALQACKEEYPSIPQ